MRPRRLTPKNPSEVFLAAVRALQELADKEPNHVDYAIGGFLSDQIKSHFEKRNKVKPSRGRPSIWRLIGKPDPDFRFMPPHGDHVSLWISEGKPSHFASQPYGLTWEGITESVDFCKENGLQFSVDARSWHFPGSTVLVTFTKAEL